MLLGMRYLKGMVADMELRHLRYFVAVAEAQNITRAAAALHVSQPPLSRQIRDLEAELGVPLFQRGGKSVRLTEAGRMFVPEALAVLQRAEAAVQSVKAAAGGDRGEVQVGYAPSLSIELLPAALRRFQETAPGVKIVLHDLSTGEMLAGLRERRLQVALMARVSPAALRGLLFAEVLRYPVCVAAAPGPSRGVGAGAEAGIRLSELAGERLIAYSRADYPEYHDWLETLFSGMRRPPVIVEEHDSAMSLIAAVEAGRGLAMVPACLACLAGPRLKLRPLKPAPPPLIVGIVTRRGVLTPLEQRFVDAARQPLAPRWS